MCPVGLAEALNVRRADEADRLGHQAPDLDQLGVGDRHPLDRLSAFRLDHRARDRIEAAPLEVAEDVNRELLAVAYGLHHRVLARVAKEELELARVLAAVDPTRSEPL